MTHAELRIIIQGQPLEAAVNQILKIIGNVPVMRSLPEDNEISQVASDEMQQDWNRLEYKDIYRDGFIDGATWLRNKAKGQCR